MNITLNLTRGEAVSVLAALRTHNGKADLRLTEYTKATGKASDQIKAALEKS